MVHVVHRGAPGGLFDRADRRGAFIDALAPLADEAIVEKPRPNAFSDTDLASTVGPSGSEIVVAGFMTHNCVSSTVRTALDLGLITQSPVTPARPVTSRPPMASSLRAMCSERNWRPWPTGMPASSTSRN